MEPARLLAVAKESVGEGLLVGMLKRGVGVVEVVRLAQSVERTPHMVRFVLVLVPAFDAGRLSLDEP